MKLPIPLIALAGLIPCLGVAQVYVSETFADGERATQNPPNSLQWFSTLTSSMTVEVGALNLVPTSSTVRAGVAYFTAPGSGVELGLGEVLTFSLTFTPTATSTVTSPNALRFGIFDSNGVRLTGDSNPADISYLGYAAFVNSLNSATRLKERIGTGALITSLAAGVYGSDLAIGSGDGDVLNFVGGSSYTASIIVTRDLEDKWMLGFNLTGPGIGTHFFETEVAGNITRFDTIGMGINSDISPTAFTDISVSVAPIPEPSTVALFASAGVAFLVIGMRVRRRRSVLVKGGVA